mgnify:CR=1 FL=1
MAKKSNKLEGYTDTVSILETMKEGRYMPKWVEQNNIIPQTKGDDKNADGTRDIRVNERETTKKEQKEEERKIQQLSRTKPKTSKRKNKKE